MKNHYAGIINISKASFQANEILSLLTSILGNEEPTEIQLAENSCVLITTGDGSLGHADDGDVFLLWRGIILGFLVDIPFPHRTDKGSSLLYCYKTYKDDFARHVNGLFTLVVHDRRKSLTLLIQDRCPGIQTLYYAEHNNQVYFASSLKVLRALAPSATNQLDVQALYQFLRWSYIAAPLTVFEGARQIPAGKLLRVHHGGLDLVEYDPWIQPDQRLKDKEEALSEYRGLISESIRSYREQHQDSGFFLSGGFDTSINVALAAAETGPGLLTVGLGAEGFNTDQPFARRVAELYGTDHKEFLFEGSEIEVLPQLVWLMENPFFEPGTLLKYFALQYAGGFTRHMIGGELIDQVFGSCAASALAYMAKNRRGPLQVKTLQRLIQLVTRNPLTACSPFWAEVENRLIGQLDVNSWIGVHGFRRSDALELLRNKIRPKDKYEISTVPGSSVQDLFTYCCTVLNRDYGCYGILTPHGKFGEALGVEVFSPSFDKRVFDFILALDTPLRTLYSGNSLENPTNKFLQKELARKLLPPEITERPKQGGAINPAIHLRDAKRVKAVKRRLLRSEFLNEMFRMNEMENMFANVTRNAKIIFMLLSFDLWYEIFMKQSVPKRPDYTLSDYL